MSKWDDFKKGFGDLADKTVNKTRELTDTAALKIKIANKEADRDIEYKNLGKLTYAKLKKLKGIDPDAVTLEISQTLEKLDAIHRELITLKAEEKARKEAKEAEKAANDAEKKAEEEKLNLEIMEEFNEARVVADEEYEKAKQAAEDAKTEG
jgi:hypothetical protein